MQPSDIQMADRLLRQWPVGLAITKDTRKPLERLAEITAKTRRKRQIVCRKPDVVLIREPLRKLQRSPKLLLRLIPIALQDKAQPARVETFQIRLGILRDELF